MATLSLLWPLNRGWVQQSCCTSCTLRASFRSSAWFGRNWSLHSTGLEAKNREKSQIAKKLNKYGHRFIKRVEKNLLANISWFVLSCCKGRGKENIPILIWRWVECLSGGADSWSHGCVSLTRAVGAEALAHRREDIVTPLCEGCLHSFLTHRASYLDVIKR